MLRAMIDSMVFDAIVDHPGIWADVSDAVREKRLHLMTTPVQELQIAAIPDALRRKQLQRVPREAVPATFEGAVYDAVSDERPRHVADAAIAETARERSDVLVTEDARLAERARAAGVTVWDVGELCAALSRG